MEISCFHGIRKCSLVAVIPLQGQFASIQPCDDYLQSTFCLTPLERLYIGWPVTDYIYFNDFDETQVLFTYL
jgi:hypothetical protein